MIKADFPNTFTDLSQVNSYLYKLAEKINLNFANTTAEAIWNETAKALTVLSDKEASAKEKADILASYSAMRSLIIKTADYTVENSEKIRLSMAGEYLAKSDFGDYFEKTTVDIEGTPVGITQLYGYTSGITGDFGDITVDSHNFIKTGLLYYDDNSLPIYGVGVGELATKVDANGHTVLDRSNLLATYTADEIAFWQNSKKVAYINNGKMYMPAANATFESLDCTNATVIGLEVGKNVSMGPDAVISWGNVNNKPTNLATTDDIPTKTSELTNDSDYAYATDIPDVSSFITEETATQITKNTVTSTYIEAMKLTVGKEILMGPDAVISWGNVNNKPTNLATTDDIPDISNCIQKQYGTYITDTAIWSGSLTANNLTVTGGSINIDTSTKGDNLIKLSYASGGAYAYTRIAPLGLELYDSVGSYSSYSTLHLWAGQICMIASGGRVNIHTNNERHIGIVEADEIYIGGTDITSLFATTSDLSSYATKSYVTSQGYYSSGDNINVKAITSLSVYNDTVSYATNMYVGSTGIFHRTTNTSSRKIKHDIEPLTEASLDPKKLYQAEAVQFRYNEDVLPSTDLRYDTLLPGFIVEDLVNVYPVAVDIDEEGEPFQWNPQYLIPPMLALIQGQKKEIDSLLERVNALENGGGESEYRN